MQLCGVYGCYKNTANLGFDNCEQTYIFIKVHNDILFKLIDARVISVWVAHVDFELGGFTLRFVGEQCFVGLLDIRCLHFTFVSGDHDLRVLVELCTGWDTPTKHLRNLYAVWEVVVHLRAGDFERCRSEHPHVEVQIFCALVLSKDHVEDTFAVEIIRSW